MGYKILLADDSVTVQKIITLTFSDEGVDVLTVNNGDEAIHRLQYMRPALVMADVSIPGKNGYEICEYVKNHPEMKDTPVVLLVPAFEPFDEERARRIGADKHLTKPFQSIRTLITTVKTLLEGRPPKFATGSLNNAVAQAQAPEPPKATVVEAAAVSPVVPVRPTQPFPDEPEPELVAEVSPEPETVSEVAEEAPAVDIWKSEPFVETEDVFEMEDVLGVESEPAAFAPEPPAEIEHVVEEVPPIPESKPEPELILVANEVTDAVTQAEVTVIDDNLEIVIEPVMSVEVETPVAAQTEQPAAQRKETDDLDHVLDLDDVLDWPTTVPVEAPQVAVASSHGVATAEAVIPQSVIDEIVNRVVAQLSEKLTIQLASQLAPEVAELVKQQSHQDAVVAPQTTNPDADALLDLD